MNPWLDRPRFHWAHQGGAREGPSNTVHAMRLARKAGADGLEMDLHATSDGHLVVSHDARLNRMCGSGPWDGKAIADLTLADVQAANAAFNWVSGKVDVQGGPKDGYELREHQPTIRVPTFAEVLETFPGVALTVELKAPDCHQLLKDLLDADRASRGPRDVVVSAMKDEWLAEFQLVAPDEPTTPGASYVKRFVIRSIVPFLSPPENPGHAVIQPADCAGVFGPVKKWPVIRSIPITTRRVVKDAHARGMAVHVWTVDDPKRMRRNLRIGVDGIMTDAPSVLAAVLKE